jgi:hypothetical protein
LYIDKTLAFAVVFGLESKFIKKIAGLLADTKIHTRYQSETGMDLNDFSKSFAATFQSSTATNSSSGGG